MPLWVVRRAADLLTLSRLPLAAAVWIDPSSPTLLLVLMAAAAVTDVLDGWLARRAECRTRDIGVWLDPLCDKVFVLSVLAAVWVTWHPAALLLVMIATRELLQAPVLLLLRPRRYDFHAARIGKATTSVQFAAVAAILLWPAAVPALALAAFAAGLAAGLTYFHRALVGRGVVAPFFPIRTARGR